MIAQTHGKKLRLVKGFGWALKLLSCVTSRVNKAFGSLTYDKELSEYERAYIVVNLDTSIEESR